MIKILQDVLSEKFATDVIISSSFPIGGGCINKCIAIQTNEGKFFVKQNAAAKFPFMLHAEAGGLQIMQSAVPELIPGVIADFEFEDMQYLILEFIESGKKQENYWVDFAEKLASLHRNSSQQFGLEFDNYMGSLRQINTFESDWVHFFILRRLEPQMQIAIDKKELHTSLTKQFNRLCGRLNNIFPVEVPALIHGDLWSGNYLTGPDGYARIVDPAVYYGHREADLAMTKLFGGFDSEFYSSYNNTFPTEPGFLQRVDIYNLYPLLIHVNLFGGGYAGQVEQIMSKF